MTHFGDRANQSICAFTHSTERREIKVTCERKYTADKRRLCRSQQMDRGHPGKGLNSFWLHQHTLFVVGAFSMRCGCRCLKSLRCDLDVIVVHSNLLSYLLGFACVSGNDEAPPSVGILSSCNDLIKC